VLQVHDVLENGYWHARSLDYLGGTLPRLLEWLRVAGRPRLYLPGRAADPHRRWGRLFEPVVGTASGLISHGYCPSPAPRSDSGKCAPRSKHDDGKLTSTRLYVEKDGIKPPM
jgi:hypothetical protein